MTVKQLKTRLESMGYSYTGDSKFHKDIANADVFENEANLLVGSLTFTKQYTTEFEGKTFNSCIEYYVNRNVVIMSAINSVGQKTKMFRGELKNISFNDEGKFQGFEPYQYTKGIK